MSLGASILGADEPQKNITLGQKSRLGLLIKKLPETSMEGGTAGREQTHRGSRRSAAPSQTTPGVQTHQMFLLHDITGEGEI